MIEKLPSFKDIIIIHYGCAGFESTEHKIYWAAAISHKPNKSYFFENKNEIDITEKLNVLIQKNKDKIFVHWSMNGIKFGFKAIKNRYFELTKKDIELEPLFEIDLSEYLKNKYGIHYIDRKGGRLNNLAELNSFSGLKKQKEVINKNDAADRIELLYSIVQAENQGKLKISHIKITQFKKPKKLINSYFINIIEKEKKDFYTDLKEMFPNEIGKSIKAIIDILIHEGVLSIGLREYANFIAELKELFTRDIGTYQSIQNTKYIDAEIKEPIEKKLKKLIIRYKIN